MKKVGVLDSSQFSSLHPGYFVVFAGVYDARRPRPQSAIIDAHRHGFGGAYPRRITAVAAPFTNLQTRAATL